MEMLQPFPQGRAEAGPKGQTQRAPWVPGDRLMPSTETPGSVPCSDGQQGSCLREGQVGIRSTANPNPNPQLNDLKVGPITCELEDLGQRP